MIVYRLSKSEWSSDLSGKGAAISGGRWNSRGNALLYSSQSRALCTAEIAVHVPLGMIPVDYCLITIEIPDEVPLIEINPDNLKPGWKSYPGDLSTRVIGDQFIREKKYLVMKVPSAVVPGDFNFLINPGHPEFGRIRIVSVELSEFDARLFK